jgi:tRNA (guanine37-N1)-methyltransferase
MLIDVVTLFPSQVEEFLNYSIIKRAVQDEKVKIQFHDLRRWAVDERGSVDDRPYGGGLGMILRVEPVVSAIKELREWVEERPARKKLLGSSDLKKELVVIFDARGEKYSQKKAFEFAELEHLILICGHYEGFDERILEFVDLSLSIGDFVLTGGEIPALLIVDSVVRLLPGVLKEGVVEEESHSTNLKFEIFNLKSKDENFNLKKKKEIKGKTENNLEEGVVRLRSPLEYPQYTRPEEYEGLKVPSVLLSGNHGEIEKWRKGSK